MNSTVVQQQCDEFTKQSNDKNGFEQWQMFFDTITTELEKDKSSITINSDDMNKIISTVIKIDKITLDKSLPIKTHRLWTILRDYLTQFLFDKQRILSITNLSIFFRNVYVLTAGIDDLQRIFLQNSIIDQICLFFKQVIIHSQQIELITVINHLMYIYQRILMLISDSAQNPLLMTLFECIAQCMNSNFYALLLKSITHRVPPSDVIQTLFFDTCVEFLYWQPYENDRRRLEILHDLSKNIITVMDESNAFNRHTASTLRLCCLLALDVVFIDDENESRTINAIYGRLVEYCIERLASDMNQSDQRKILEILCHLTHDINLMIQMKENFNLKGYLLKLTSSEDGEISLGAYRILAMIMTEQDIKNLENATKIINIYYLYTISMLDDPVQRTAFSNLLHSLKCLVQHEQIKVECIEQGMVPLLIQCVMQDDHSVKNIQQYALEILLAISIVKKGCEILQNERKFLEKMNLLKNSDRPQLKRVVDHLLWQIEQKSTETKVVDQSTQFQFDIMISYSHTDKTICFQLFDHLIRDGYRVWLDREQMHGDTMAAMAHAIENSEFVLICMSEAYKQSPYCQAEAQYAFQRRCKLIPLVMKTKYKPDGWLGILISGKMYVDFSKFEFTTAYNMVKNEIMKKKEATANAARSDSIGHHGHMIPSIPLTVVPKSEGKILKLPHCVNTWTNEDVHSFLIENNFSTLLPVLGGFDGHLLHQTYLMCQTGRETMFQAMRNEIAATENNPILTLGTYLRFLKELEKYIPINKDQLSSQTVSTACILM